MAYYSGSISSYAELLNVITVACAANGWVFSSGILSKGSAFIKPSLGVAAEGICFEGGTGQIGGELIHPSLECARLGRIGTETIYVGVQWPAEYHIHVNAGPDEVYVVLQSGITDFLWAAWGISTVPLPGSGLWITGSAPKNYTGQYGGIHMTDDFGDTQQYWACPALFWATNRSTSAGFILHLLQSTADGSWPKYQGVGVPNLSPRLNRQPNAWNGSNVLLPAREWEVVAESKRRLLIDCAHARIVRMHHLVPAEQITLGHDVWRCYPFYRKNASTPNGGTSMGSQAGINHSGTFGWALREGSA